ncbi:MAG TPA: DUF134 domain-containing protein [Candidatus Acetothermia bacterium]|nr:DUF134 domain-containing protein [Candidatus Acetothermia bacterium]
MGRYKKLRYCQEFMGYNLLKPSGVPLSQIETVVIALDELEAMRLCDLEGLDQGQAAEEMGVSRGTVQRLVYSARRKMVDVVIHGKALTVEDTERVVVRAPGRGGRGRHGRGMGGRRG